VTQSKEENKGVKAPKWLELHWLLSLFGPRRRNAARNYRDFVEKADIDSVENPAIFQSRSAETAG